MSLIFGIWCIRCHIEQHPKIVFIKVAGKTILEDREKEAILLG